MDFWNLAWLVLMLGGAVVGPAIWLVVEVRGLGADRLSEKQRRTGEEELRKAGIVRDGEEWEAHDLDELLLNMRRYEQWRSIGANAPILLTGGVGMVALVVMAGGMVSSSVYTTLALAILWSTITLGACVGYITSDRRFAARAGALAAPHADAIFTGQDGVTRRPQWFGVIDLGLIIGVSFCTLLYAVGRGGTLENATTHAVIAHHPWLIWYIPVALCVMLTARELLVWWELRRPPLRLTEQVELAERTDLHRRREAYKSLVSDWTVFFSIPLLSMFYLMTFEGLVDSSIHLLLYLAAFVAWITEGGVYGMADTRRKRLARRASDVGLRGEGRVV